MLLGRFLGADVAVNAADERIKAALGLQQSDQLGPLLGNDLVVARTRNGVLVAWVVKDQQALRRVAAHVTRFRAVVRGSLLLAGAPQAVRQAENERNGLTPQLFVQRLHGLPADSLLRAEGSGPLPRVKLPWARAVTSYALTLRADDSGLHARLRAATRALPAAEVPLAPGAAAPAPLARTNGATAGIRDLGHLVSVLRLNVPKAATAQLGGTATVWSPDLKTFTVTIPVADPQLVVRALRGVNLARAHLPGARIGAAGRTVVVTTDPAASLARLAAGSPRRIGNLSGALTGVIRGQSLGQVLIDRFGLPPIASIALGALGDTTFAVRTATTGVEASADLSIRK